ncbi:MAG: H-type lectin domain-containing protein [Pseudomonadota bacterium]
MRIMGTILAVFAAVMLLRPDPAYAGRLEAGTYTAGNTLSGPRAPTRINFQQNFDTVPVVIALADSQGNNSASIRITNITTTGFDSLILEPDNWDGRHISQIVHYVAIEPGRHILPGGTVIEAGRTDTSAVQFGPGVSGSASFTNVSFSQPLSGITTVIAQIQTANSETRNVPSQSSRPHITALTVNQNSNGFQLALERSQSSIGTVLVETVGWIAFPAGASDNFEDIAGNTISWGADNSGNVVRGWDDGCFSVVLPITSASRVVVAKKRSRNNGDGGWFRYCSLTSSTISLRVDEDRAIDNERRVAAADAESAAIIAFSQPFHANLRGEIQVTKTSVTIANAVNEGFAIPGSTVEYLITVENIGNAPVDQGSLIISDLLSQHTALLVGDIAGTGSGPIEASGSALALGLGYTFLGLGSGGDNIDFSDISGFGYTPSDGGDGSDSNVRAFVIVPSGHFEGDRGSGAPQLSLRYRVLIE